MALTILGTPMSHSHEEHMRRAIALSREGSILKKTGGVFGAVVVKDGEIIGEGYNKVIKNNDPTWHAEMEAIREACKKLGTPHLDGCLLYTSSEPCPMCLSAAYWAHIKHIYYASTIHDAQEYGNFADVSILDEIRKNPNERLIKFTEVLRPEAVEVWKEYAAMPDKKHY